MAKKKAGIFEDPFADPSSLSKEGIVPGLEEKEQESKESTTQEKTKPKKASTATPKKQHKPKKDDGTKKKKAGTKLEDPFSDPIALKKEGLIPGLDPVQAPSSTSDLAALYSKLQTLASQESEQSALLTQQKQELLSSIAEVLSSVQTMQEKTMPASEILTELGNQLKGQNQELQSLLKDSQEQAAKKLEGMLVTIKGTEVTTSWEKLEQKLQSLKVDLLDAYEDSKENVDSHESDESSQVAESLETLLKNVESLGGQLEHLEKSLQAFEGLSEQLTSLEENTPNSNQSQIDLQPILTTLAKLEEQSVQSGHEMGTAPLLERMEQLNEEMTRIESHVVRQSEDYKSQLVVSFEEFSSTQKKEIESAISSLTSKIETLEERGLQDSSGRNVEQDYLTDVAENIQKLAKHQEVVNNVFTMVQGLQTSLDLEPQFGGLHSKLGEISSFLANHSTQENQGDDASVEIFQRVEQTLQEWKQEILGAINTVPPAPSESDLLVEIQGRLRALSEQVEQKTSTSAQETQQHGYDAELKQQLEELLSNSHSHKEEMAPILKDLKDILLEIKSVRKDSFDTIKGLNDVHRKLNEVAKKPPEIQVNPSRRSQTNEQSPGVNWNEALTKVVANRIVIAGATIAVTCFLFAIPEVFLQNNFFKKLFYIVGLFFLASGSIGFNFNEKHWSLGGENEREKERAVVVTEDEMYLESLNVWSRKVSIATFVILGFIGLLFLLFV